MMTRETKQKCFFLRQQYAHALRLLRDTKGKKFTYEHWRLQGGGQGRPELYKLERARLESTT